MSTFSFDETAGSSQSTAKPKLAGNEIHTVKLEACEIQDIQGVKDPTQLYRVLKFKFSNEDGYYEHTVFEPRPDDFKRTETEFTNKNGNKEKIPQPSNVESMMLLFKHIIDSFVPEVSKKIDNKEVSLNAPNWETLRALIVKICSNAKERTSKIKLMKNSKTGDGQFPGFFTGLTREGKAYIRNNFIGEKIAFSAYELTRIQNEANAKPTNMGSAAAGFNLSDPKFGSDSDLDLDFDLGNL